MIFPRSPAAEQYRVHSRQAMHAGVSPSLSSAREIKKHPSPLSKILIADKEGLNSPLCLKEQAISQVLHPLHVGISNIFHFNIIAVSFRSVDLIHQPSRRDGSHVLSCGKAIIMARAIIIIRRKGKAPRKIS